jgi:hypothetical protein
MIKQEIAFFQSHKFENQGRFAQNINHIVDLAINLCKKAVLLDYRAQEWMRFLDFMKEIRSFSGGLKENNEGFADFGHILFANVFTEFAKNVPLTLFLEVFDCFY